MPKVNFSVQVEAETYEQLDEASREARVSKSAVARKLIEDGLKQSEQKKEEKNAAA